MVRRILLIGTLILMVLEAGAQVGLYCSNQVAPNVASENVINHYDNSVLYLSLLDGGEYNLVLSLSGGSHHSDKQLSFGTYTMAGNVLSLSDELFGFVMQMEFVNDICLRPIKGLSIMKGKSFVFSEKATFSSYRYDDAKSLLFENQRHANGQEKGIQGFPTGKYRNRPMGSYELDLLQRGRYEYNIDGFLISRGSWKRDGKKLLFYDDEMLLPFFAPIDEEGKNVFLVMGNPRIFPLSILEASCQNGNNAIQDDKDLHSDVAQCQVEGKEYNLDWNEEGFSCDILFINGSEYYIDLSYYATDDIVYTLVLSYGNCITEGSLIKMTDKRFGYEMLMECDEDCLKVKKGFSFMNNRCLNYNGWSYTNDVPIANHKDSVALSEDRQRYVEKHADLLPLPIGLYASDSPFNYKLSLREQQVYQLFYYDIVLSKGQWKRDGNILQLYDTALNCTFHLLVGNGVLVSKLLPGDNTEGLVLKKKSANTPVFRPSTRGFGCSRKRNNQ